MNTSREPLAIRAAAVAVADALVHLLVVYGLQLTEDQVAATSGFLNLASILAVVLWTRGKVTPVDDPRLPDYPAHEWTDAPSYDDLDENDPAQVTT